MLETQSRNLDDVIRRFETLRDLHGPDVKRWPPEAQAEAWGLHQQGRGALADAVSVLVRSCPDC